MREDRAEQKGVRENRVENSRTGLSRREHGRTTDVIRAVQTKKDQNRVKGSRTEWKRELK